MSVTVPPWTNAPALLPRGVAQDFIGLVEQASLALALGRTMRMSEAAEAIPVVSFMPQAGWVSPAYGGRKPATEIRWTAQEIKAEEVAATLAVPNAWIMDAHFDVEGQVERSLSQAIATAIDDAVLWGTQAPASFPAGGINGFARGPVTGPDPLTALSNAMGTLEADGIMPDGVAGGAGIGSILRDAYLEHQGDFAEAPTRRIWGLPVRSTLLWSTAAGAVDAFVGGFQYLAMGIREAVTFGRSNDGVLLNASNQIIASAFQDNVTLVKIYARIGCAIGQPYTIRGGAGTAIKPFVKVAFPEAATNGADENGDENGAETASESSGTPRARRR